MPRRLFALLLISSSFAADPFYETFGPEFDAKRFLTPIPNKNTSVRDGVLWTRGASGGKYPPKVYLPVEGKDLTISFRYRHLAAGGWLWFFVDGEDGFGSEDHMLRVKLLRDGVQLEVDAHSKDNAVSSAHFTSVIGTIPLIRCPVKTPTAPGLCRWRTTWE